MGAVREPANCRRWRARRRRCERVTAGAAVQDLAASVRRTDPRGGQELPARLDARSTAEIAGSIRGARAVVMTSSASMAVLARRRGCCAAQQRRRWRGARPRRSCASRRTDRRWLALASCRSVQGPATRCSRAGRGRRGGSSCRSSKQPPRGASDLASLQASGVTTTSARVGRSDDAIDRAAAACRPGHEPPVAPSELRRACRRRRQALAAAAASSAAPSGRRGLASPRIGIAHNRACRHSSWMWDSTDLAGDRRRRSDRRGRR